jgi:hydrazine synthase alpha subunit-like protein
VFPVRCALLLWVLSGGAVPAPAGGAPDSFLYTEAREWDSRATLASGERFPGGARLMLFSGTGTRPLVPDFAASADAAVSFDGKRVLFAGKRGSGEPWQVWEMPLAGGVPRRVTSGREDCIRPFYLPQEKAVYARKTAQGFQLETAPLAGGAPLRLTYAPGSQVPDAVLGDGRVLYEAPYPADSSGVREIFTVASDGSGVETHRCDHGNDRHSAAEVASGDIVFQTGARLARFTSARAGQVEVTLPRGEFAGPAAEAGTGEWLVAYRGTATEAFGICRVKPGQAAAPPIALVRGGAFQPVVVKARTPPPYHPSALGKREGANVLCLNAYTSKSARIPRGSAAVVRVWGRTDGGVPVALGESKVDADGSFYLQVPSERPLRFELRDSAGRTVAAERGWFWMRQGEQRVCVGCHAGPERAPENAVPLVLLRTQTPARIGLPAAKVEAKR